MKYVILFIVLALIATFDSNSTTSEDVKKVQAEMFEALKDLNKCQDKVRYQQVKNTKDAEIKTLDKGADAVPETGPFITDCVITK